jgi:hypothetical protein
LPSSLPSLVISQNKKRPIGYILVIPDKALP